MLVRRLRELASAGVVRIDPKQKGRGHTYRLTAAGEDFRPLIVLMSEWGQRWGQESIGPDDLDPQLLMWALRGQVDPADIPEQGFVIRFEFRGLPKVHRKLRYWWLLLRPEDIEICVKDYGVRVDLVVDADLGAFTKVWLGYSGLLDATEMAKSPCVARVSQSPRHAVCCDWPTSRYSGGSCSDLIRRTQRVSANAALPCASAQVLPQPNATQ